MIVGAPDRRGERGFTIIEMVVGLVLVGVMLAVALPSLSNLLGFANRAAAESDAAGDAQYLAALIEHDLRQAAAPRAFGLATGTNVIASLGTARAQDHDLLFAGPRALMFWSDVAPTPGPEVVRWYLVRNSPMCDQATARGNWCVVRDVMSGAVAALPTSGTVVREVVATGKGSFPSTGVCAPGIPAGDRLFCYKFEAPARAGVIASYDWANWVPTCSSFWGSPSTPAGSNWNDGGGAVMAGTGERGVAHQAPRLSVAHSRFGAASTIASLDRVTAVGVVAPGGGRVDGDSSRGLLVGGVDLRNRSTAEYRTAILCGAR